jgi:hypothetical protein
LHFILRIENIPAMTIPADGPAPEPEKRLQIITQSDSDTLEKIRQHALAMMFSMSQGQGNVPDEYAQWNTFVGEIEAEQQKRLALFNS